MKYLVVSDIHGSVSNASLIPKLLSSESCDKLIILGDLYYHGPRNPLSDEYNPMEVASILNKLKDKIICIRGNCDAHVDEHISEFDFSDSIILEIGNKNFFFTHGHLFSEANIPIGVDVFVYGHLHIPFIKENNNLISANPGSISLPKNNSKNSYMTIDEEYITIKSTSGELIDKKKYN